MLKPRKPTAPATVILFYWTTALLLLVAVVTGLQVASAFGLLQSGLPGLPSSRILGLHAFSCLLLASGCVLFLSVLRDEARAGRTRGFAAAAGSRSWRRTESLLSQCFLALVGLETLWAALLLLGGGIGLARLHFATTIVLIAFVPLHVAVQIASGGLDHALRMFRPTPEPFGAEPIGRLAPHVARSRGRNGATRLFGIALGLVFSAAAVSAFVSHGDQAARHRLTGLSSPVPFEIAWGPSIRPAR